MRTIRNYSVILVLFCIHKVFSQQPSPSSSVWTHICVDNQYCRRTPRTSNDTEVIPLSVCKLNCNPSEGSLLPLPKGTVRIGPTRTPFHLSRIIYDPSSNQGEVGQLLEEAVEVLKLNLAKLINSRGGSGNGSDPENSVTLQISVADRDLTILSLGTDEGYNLVVNGSDDNSHVTVTIQAGTFFGARHGLGTLSQLVAYDEDKDAFQIVNSAEILDDSPSYTYRGVLLDTSRNFISVAGLKRLIDGMSHNKLNMLHWHITDSHSFPMEVAGHGEFTQYGAYSSSKVYTLEEMKDLVHYARVRGVKIVPELDQPAHMGYGWQWGPSKGLGELVVCLNKEPWYLYCVEPPCGQINIANQEIYPLLTSIFQSMFGIFDNDLFHMGGDEVNIGCYNSTEVITNWMNEKGYSRNNWDGFIQLWGEFQKNAHNALVQAANTTSRLQTIMWTSELTMKQYISPHLPRDDYIIQIWTDGKDKMIADLVEGGYRVIFSNYDALYLDCGFQAWVGGPGHNWCTPYKTWQGIYSNSPYHLYRDLVDSSELANKAKADGLFLGGEATLWTEQADEKNMESRIFPRVSALAERLWTDPDPSKYTWAEAEYRMVTNTERLIQTGVGADRLQPEFCSLYQGMCYPFSSSPPTTTEDPSGSALTLHAHGKIFGFLLVCGVILISNLLR